VKEFDINTFKGQWYISAGLNPLFDIFDCQVRLVSCGGYGPECVDGRGGLTLPLACRSTSSVRSLRASFTPS
jgi:hypothetical protein